MLISPITPEACTLFRKHRVLNKYLSNKFSCIFANLVPSWNVIPTDLITDKLQFILTNQVQVLLTPSGSCFLLSVPISYCPYLYQRGIVVLLWSLFTRPDSELLTAVTISSSSLWKFFKFYGTIFFPLIMSWVWSYFPNQIGNSCSIMSLTIQFVCHMILQPSALLLGAPPSPSTFTQFLRSPKCLSWASVKLLPSPRFPSLDSKTYYLL